jgi:hypothetical protein
MMYTMPVTNFTSLNKIDFYIIFREFGFFIKSIHFNEIKFPGVVYFGDLHKFNARIYDNYYKIYRTYKRMKSHSLTEIIKLYT